MYKGSAWFLHSLIKALFGNRAFKVTFFSGQYSRYSYKKLIHLQENAPYSYVTTSEQSAWRQPGQKYIPYRNSELKQNLSRQF